MLAGLPESIIVELDFYVTVRMPVEPNLTAEEAHDEAAVPEALYENGTGGDSGNSSQTDMQEKLGGEKEKYRRDSSAEAAVITWHSGRADLHTVLDGMAKIATGPISVNGKYTSGLTFIMKRKLISGQSFSVWPSDFASCGLRSCQGCSHPDRGPQGPTAHLLLQRDLWVVKRNAAIDVMNNETTA